IYQLEDYFLEHEQEAVQAVFSIQGFSFAGSGQNTGMAFINLKDWSEREDPSLSAAAVGMRAMGGLSQIKDAIAYAFSTPAIPELGIAGGYAFYLQDVRPSTQENRPQFRVDIDVERAAALGLSIAEINNTLSIAWGGRYIDDFIDRGRVKRVYMQGEAEYRMLPEDFNRWSVRNNEGEMVPFSAFASYTWDYGSPRLQRYNGVPAVEINGEAAPGVSTGEAMAEIERLAAQLPPGFGIDWTGVSYQERAAGTQTPLLYTLSLLIVFLCLAALYESWTVPTAVIMVAPLGILGALMANGLRGMERD